MVDKVKSMSSDAIGDLRIFLQEAKKAGELEVVHDADPDLEVGALLELSHENLYPPVILFENMKGIDPRFRVLANVRTAHFVVGDLTLDAVKAYRKKPKEKREPIPPRLVNTGPVFDNVEEGKDVDILKFPAPRWHAKDGGKYIGTECCVITKDPDSDWVNLGAYRVMVHDHKTVCIYIETGKDGDVIRRKYWAQGKSCPMVVTLGQAPILGVVSGNSAPEGVSEYSVAGGRIGRPIDVVKGKVTGIPFPADAEIVFEGHMPPPEQDLQNEGPFGEWPGYYASADRPEPVMYVEAVYYRNNPLIIGQPPTRPTLPGRQIRIPRVAELWDAIEAAGVPGIEAVWKLSGGGSRFIDVISIKQLHPGHAKMAGLVSAGCGAGSYMTRLVIVVDDDIDVTKEAEVMWAVATRWDPKTQTDIIDGCWTGRIDPLLSPDKRKANDITTARMIIYAVRPYHWKDEFPMVNMVDRDYAKTIRDKWKTKLSFLRQEQKSN